MRSNTQKFLAVMFLVFQIGGTSAFAQDALEKKLDAAMRAILSKRTALELGVAVTAGGAFLSLMHKALAKKNSVLSLLLKTEYADYSSNLKIKSHMKTYFFNEIDKYERASKSLPIHFVKQIHNAFYYEYIFDGSGNKSRYWFSGPIRDDINLKTDLKSLKQDINRAFGEYKKYHEYRLERLFGIKVTNSNLDYFDDLLKINKEINIVGKTVTYGGIIITVGAFIAMLIEDEHDDVGMRERIERMDVAELRDFLRHNPVLLDLIPKEEKHSPKGNS